MNIIQNKNYWGLNIEKVEEIYDAKYIGDFSIRQSGGYWSEVPVSIFHQPNYDKSKGHSEYLGLFIRDGKLFICNGESAFSEPLYALRIENGDYLLSGYPHDYIQYKDYMLDGQRSGYIRHSTDGVLVKLLISGNNFFETSLELIEKNLTLAEEEY